MSAQEAAYHVLSIPLAKCSRKTIFINTGPPVERARILKTNEDLRRLNEDSTEVYMEDVFEKYCVRPETLEEVCLAQFASEYVPIRRETDLDEDNLDIDQSKEYRRKKKFSMIRYRRYKLQQDRVNYFREQVLLFMPWRNASQQIESVNCEEVYNENVESIEVNRRLFSAIGDEVLEEALENVHQEVLEVKDEAEEFAKEKNSPSQRIDVIQQGGRETPTNKTENRYNCPKRIPTEDMCMLASRPEGICYAYSKCIQTGNHCIPYFLKWISRRRKKFRHQVRVPVYHQLL